MAYTPPWPNASVDRLTPEPQVVQPLPAIIVAPVVTGDLNAVEMLEVCGVLGDGRLACELAAANGQLHILQFMHRRGYDLREMETLMPLAAANERASVVGFLQDVEAGRVRVQDAEPVTYPSVSVLLANYNHAKYLDTSLSGILGQEHPATEVIVVDDGSTDSSIQVIERYAKHHANLQLLVNPSNQGQHYSIQRALQAATGEYVVWASSDDLLLPRFLQRSLSVLMEHPTAGLCFSRLAVFVDGSTATRVYNEAHAAPFDYGKEPSYLSPAQLTTILKRHYLWMSGNTVVARREALLEIGGFEADLRWHADWFAYYVVALRYGACMIPDTLAMMRERTGTYSASGVGNHRAQRQVLQALMDIIKSEKYNDLLPIFKRCPSLFSPFGMNMASAALTAPRHRDFVWPMAQRYISQFVRRKFSPLRKAWQRATQRGRSVPAKT
jgi:glycosyltransferase involved in cell wall biosynthesis